MARPSQRKVNRPKRDRAQPSRSAGKDVQPASAPDTVRSRMEDLLLTSPAVIYTCKSSGDYRATYVTPNVKAQLGYDPQDFTDRTDFWLNHIHPNDRQRVQRELAALFETDQHNHEYRFRHKDGTYRWMHDQTRLIRDSQGRPVEIVGTWIDVTARKQVDDDLRESEARYKTLFESSPDGILIADVKTRRFQYANAAACAMLGRTEEELRNFHVDDIHPKESLDYVLSEFEAQARGEKTLSEDIPCLRKDGTVFYADVNAVKCLVDAKECNIGFFRDVTKRKQAESALLDKNVALREVLDRIEEQKREMGRTILTNVDKIIMPLIHVLEQGLPADQRRYMSLLKQSLEEIASPFISRLSAKLAGLTPTEIRICDLIRRGLSNKEIAQLEHIAPATVNKHRARIRKKLGIAHKKINLASHLESFITVQKES